MADVVREIRFTEAAQVAGGEAILDETKVFHTPLARVSGTNNLATIMARSLDPKSSYEAQEDARRAARGLIWDTLRSDMTPQEKIPIIDGLYRVVGVPFHKQVDGGKVSPLGVQEGTGPVTAEKSEEEVLRLWTDEARIAKKYGLTWRNGRWTGSALPAFRAEAGAIRQERLRWENLHPDAAVDVKKLKMHPFRTVAFPDIESLRAARQDPEVLKKLPGFLQERLKITAVTQQVINEYWAAQESLVRNRKTRR